MQAGQQVNKKHYLQAIFHKCETFSSETGKRQTDREIDREHTEMRDRKTDKEHTEKIKNWDIKHSQYHNTSMTIAARISTSTLAFIITFLSLSVFE